MMQSRSRLTAILTAALVTVSIPAATRGQDDQSGQDAQQFPARFWEFLKDSGYKQWAPYPGQGLGFIEGQAPHGAFLKVFVNREVAAQPENPPEGSIIVKENYDKSKENLLAITIMYRTKNKFDPEHNNWWWVKYTPDGKVATMNGMRLSGNVQSCINCHSGAKGNDFVFTNDSQKD